MSEKIKITIVMDDEKQIAEKQGEKGKRILVTQDPFVTLLSVLRENRLIGSGLCGGRGECGGCTVQFLEGAPMPAALERKRFSPEELRRGYRLACIARPRTDCVIRLLRNEEPEVPVLTKTIPLSENTDLTGQEKRQTENQTSGAMECPDDLDNQSDVMDYMIAVDLGTTTIAMQLFSMTGEAVDTYCEHNPQRSYGTDVLSRIQASCAGHREELQRLVCEALLRGLRRFLTYLYGSGCGRGDGAGRESATAQTGETLGEKRLRCVGIAGNTAMEHLLLGYDVQSLGRSPFTPVEIGVQEIPLFGLFACLADASQALPGLSADLAETVGALPVYLMPGISAFVGGDVVAGLYALRMLPDFSDDAAAASEGGGVRLLIDLGTNGEMAITDGRRMLVTATAAGPAFEGSGERALFGTDRIALTASFLRRGILDETGLLAEPYFSEGVPVETGRVSVSAGTGETAAFLMKKEDIRALQMAKAAIRAGIEILWEEMGRPGVAKVYLAGGFGYELDVEAAFAIGLLPARLRGRVQAVGNTSLAGAFLMGRALREGRIDRRALEERVSSGTVTESINLAKKRDFASLYLQYMNLEEN